MEFDIWGWSLLDYHHYDKAVIVYIIDHSNFKDTGLTHKQAALPEIYQVFESIRFLFFFDT